MEDWIVKAITHSNTLLKEDFNLRLDCSTSEIDDMLSYASSHHPGQDPLPNLDPYMVHPAQLLNCEQMSSSSQVGVLQRSNASSEGNKTSTGSYQNPVQISMMPHNVQIPQQAAQNLVGYAHNQISMPSTVQTSSQQIQVFTSPPDNVNSAPTCSYSIDQFLDDIQLPSSPLQCHSPEPENIIAMQGIPEATRIAREIQKLKISPKYKKNQKQHLISPENSL